jgi:hypothetical protein
MSKNIAVPEDLYAKAAELAEKDHVSVEEFVSSALADQLAGRQYLEGRAEHASKERFLKALEQVPDVEPEDYDRL